METIALRRSRAPGRTSSDRLRPRVGAVLLMFLIAAPVRAGESHVVYTGDWLRNASGGIATGTRFLDNLDVELSLDVERFPGAGTLFIHGLYNNGARFSGDLVGDLQVVSNIDADEAWRVFQLWYEFGGRDWSLKTGLYDLNSEFDVNETGSLFLNSSHGIGADLAQTGRNGPGIFPVSALALRASLETRAGRLKLVVMDAVPGDPEDPGSNAIDLQREEGVLAVFELERPFGEAGRLWAGAWTYSAAFERPFGTGDGHGNRGWYVGVERTFDLVGGNAAGFVRIGQAASEFNAFGDYIGAGFVVSVPFASRPDDRIGVAVASAGAGSHYRRFLAANGIAATRRETAWELSYRAAIGEYLVLQPDLQYVQYPAAARRYGHALVFGLRLEIAY